MQRNARQGKIRIAMRILCRQHELRRTHHRRTTNAGVGFDVRSVPPAMLVSFWQRERHSPTPGSPMSTGLFLVLLLSICIALLISSSLPMTGSSFPSDARFVKSTPNLSRGSSSLMSLVVEDGVAEGEEADRRRRRRPRCRSDDDDGSGVRGSAPTSPPILTLSRTEGGTKAATGAAGDAKSSIASVAAAALGDHDDGDGDGDGDDLGRLLIIFSRQGPRRGV